MSDIPADYPTRLNLAEQIARIERTQADLSKLLAEQRKLQAEGDKYPDEQRKLRAEARKYRWDPVFLVIGAIIAGVFARLDVILHALGVGP